MQWFRRRITSSWIKGKRCLPEKSLLQRVWWKCIVLSLVSALALCAALSCYRWGVRACRQHWFRLYDQPLREVRLTTDGVLSPILVAPYIALPMGISLMDIDIQSLKRRLQTLEQVRSAEVERHFYDQSLQIILKEEKPFARIRLEQGGEKEILYVGESGKVFHGFGFTDTSSRSLPFLTGLDLHRRTMGNAYDFGCDITPIRDFLGQCKKNYPEIYSQIRYLSLAHWDPNGEARWSRLELATQSVKRIIFSHHYWEEQFQRLHYLLKDDHLKKCFPIERIDLRLGQEVSIRLKHNRR